VTIKPLAYVVGNYTCCDSHEKICEDFQFRHLLSVARLEKGSLSSITQSATRGKAVAAAERSERGSGGAPPD